MDAEAIVGALSKVESSEWIDVLNFLSDNFENTHLWGEIVLPQLEDFQFEHKVGRDELAIVLEQIFRLTESKIQDSDMYMLLPLEFRELFSLRKDALLELGQRLIKATQSDLQMKEIRECLGSLSICDLPECEDCKKSQIITQIIKIVNTAPNIID